MAIAKFDVYSECLCRFTSFQVFLPNDVPEMMTKGNPHYERTLKTLMLLHGYSGYSSDWRNSSGIVNLANQYNLIVICPTGENSFYLDGKETGRKYATYVGEELLGYVRKTFGLSERAEDTFVGGLSMGGYGALHTALMYPQNYSAVFAFSSALIMHEVEKMKPGTGNATANYEYYKLMFGEPALLGSSVNNPEELVRRIKKNSGVMPRIYMACGTEDPLLRENRDFRDFLIKENVPMTYREGPGTHNFAFWDAFLEPAIKWFLEVEE